jgi:two-component system NtrC family sensor kinase
MMMNDGIPQANDRAAAQREQKLSAAGARIAHVVHEINVPLSLITGSLEQLGQYADASVRYIEASAHAAAADAALAALRTDIQLDYLTAHALELIDICREGARRLTHVVQQLRVYARNATAAGEPAAVDVKRLIETAMTLAACGRDVVPRIERRIPALPPVSGIAESLSQAFVNVLGNAFDALAAVPEPCVWVSASSGWLADGTRRSGWVEVLIRDNGPGIPAAVRPRIFEAFFTTKAHRSGMGLGLAIAKEIIETHGGTIALADSDAPGTLFVIRLPAAAPLQL